MSNIRLGDLLVRAGVATEAQISHALLEQQRWGGRLGTVLVRMGVLDEDLLVKALSRQMGIPRAPIGPNDPLQVPPAVLERLERGTCERYGVVPVAWVAERRTLQLAVSDPSNVLMVDDLSRRLGVRVEVLIAGETQIQQAIGRLYGGGDVDLNVGGDALALIDNAGMLRPATRASAATMPTMPAIASTPPSMPVRTMPTMPTVPPASSGWGASLPPQAPVGWGASLPPTSQPAPMPPQMPAYAVQTAPPVAPGEDLRPLAEQHARALRALMDLLVERGIVSPAELQARLGR